MINDSTTLFAERILYSFLPFNNKSGKAMKEMFSQSKPAKTSKYCGSIKKDLSGVDEFYQIIKPLPN